MTTLLPPAQSGTSTLTLAEIASLENLRALLDSLGPGAVVRYGGHDSTTVLFAGDAGADDAEVFHVELGDSLMIVNDGLTGSRTLRLETGHGVEAGDQIWISTEIDAADTYANGDESWSDGVLTLSFLVAVERVGGNSIALEERLPFDLPAGSFSVHVVESADSLNDPNLSFAETMELALATTPQESVVIDVAAGTSLVELQAIVDEAADGAVVRLAAGTFTFEATLNIARSDIALEGAGAGKTVIVATADGAGNPTIQIGPSIYNADLGAAIALTETATAGSSTLRLENGHGLQAGDRIWITRENTAEFFEEIGDTKWQDDAPLRTFLVEVVSVGGNSVALAEQLPFEFTPDESTVQTIGMVDDVSISGLTLANSYGESDPSLFENTISAETRAVSLSVSGTDGLSLRNIDIIDPASHGLALAKTINADVDGLWVHGAHNKGSGGNGYALWIRDVYNSEFTNLTLEDTRHGVLFSSYTSATDNYVHVAHTNRDINFHGGRDQDNVVVVDSLVRDGAEQEYLGTTLFVNEGETYGAPTDPDANAVSFGYVVGTVRKDLIYADESGAEIYAFEAADTIHTARGDDIVYAETGHDTIYASSGQDHIDGGSGADTVIFTGAVSDYAISATAEGMAVSSWNSRTVVIDVETFVFDGVHYAEADLIA
ncbi:hypothetical protein [Tropicimonas marinistellae]|uniref:hypothetical protein n=1 Tax=Tropicimonas marinistellae TaxID=1739787 RepID=UPI000829D426|nr:hypothetical protein [Tropicimonas marinistellae]